MFTKQIARLTVVCSLFATPAQAEEKGQAAPAPPAVEEDVPPPTVPVPEPPRGASKEDRDLWIAASAIASRIGLVRLEANRIQWDARSARTLARLEEASKREGEPGTRAAELLGRYGKAIAHNHLTLTRQWPVDPTRGCGYPAQVFHSAAEVHGVARPERELRRAREDLTECMGRAEPAIGVMAASNAEMKRLDAEVEALIGPPPAAVPRTPARKGDGRALPEATAGAKGPE